MALKYLCLRRGLMQTFAIAPPLLQQHQNVVIPVKADAHPDYAKHQPIK
ncbi:MAG: hypothetical protein JW832_07040 [Deltaproteobacteria bacterium]|nr:hypothetical protein [Deltaproteobacteria bacterium]